MTGLIERVMIAEHCQCRINCWPRYWRLKEHHRLLVKTLHRLNLETRCSNCGAVMPTAINHVNCIECGSSDTYSPYYC